MKKANDSRPDDIDCPPLKRRTIDHQFKEDAFEDKIHEKAIGSQSIDTAPQACSTSTAINTVKEVKSRKIVVNGQEIIIPSFLDEETAKNLIIKDSKEIALLFNRLRHGEFAHMC